MVKKRKRISQQLVTQNVGNAAPIKTLKLAPRFKKNGRSTTFKPAVLTKISTISNAHTENEDSITIDDLKNLAHTQIVSATPIYKILSSTNMPSYQESPRSTQDNAAPNCDDLLHVDHSSLLTEAVSGAKVTTKEASQENHQSTENPLQEITTTLSLIEELKQQLMTISYDLSQEQSTEYMTPITTQSPGAEDSFYQVVDFQLSESRAVINVHTDSEQLVQTEVPDILTENMNENNDATTSMPDTEDKDAEDSVTSTQLFASQAEASETT